MARANLGSFRSGQSPGPSTEQPVQSFEWLLRRIDRGCSGIDTAPLPVAFAGKFMHSIPEPFHPPSDHMLEAHSAFLVAARGLYANNVRWLAPARQIELVGREEVIRHLLREAGGMYDPEYTFLRRHCNAQQIIDEFAIRFIFAGEGIDNAPAEKGDFVELKRVRILDLHADRVVTETCIENWTLLLPSSRA